jgi:opacity protein-like surface antigen
MQMRSLLTCAVLIVIAAGAILAADVSGNWSGTMSMGDNQFTLNYTFKQDGEKLTGSVQGPQGDPLTLNDGKVQGDKLSFNITVQTPNGDMKIASEGTIKGAEEITLTSKMVGAPEGMPEMPPMTLKKSK